MAEIVYIVGEPGGGKTNSIIVPPNGECSIEYIKGLPDNYEGIDPKSTIIFNCDGKRLNFPSKKLGWKEGVNLFTSTYEKPLTADRMLDSKEGTKNKTGLIRWVNSQKHIKILIIDTITSALNDKEMLQERTLTYNQWYDLAKDIYAINVLAYSLREDLFIYIFGHVTLQTNVEGEEFKALLTSGKKLGKIKLESKSNNVYFTKVSGTGDSPSYEFETTFNHSTGRSPIGMFEEILIPNSLKLVDDSIRKYYSI